MHQQSHICRDSGFGWPVGLVLVSERKAISTVGPLDQALELTDFPNSGSSGLKLGGANP